MRKYVKNEQGLSLVEIVASIVLLSIILTSTYYFFINNANVNSHNQENFNANAMAREYSAKFTQHCDFQTINSSSQPLCNGFSANGTTQEKSITDRGFAVDLIIEESSSTLTHYKLQKVTIRVWEGTKAGNPNTETYVYHREEK